MGASAMAGGWNMTIASVMGTEPPKWTSWRFPGPQQPDPDDGSLPPRSGPEQDEDETAQSRLQPPAFRPENDVALARMLGCAFLIGLASIVGLLMLIF